MPPHDDEHSSQPSSHKTPKAVLPAWNWPGAEVLDPLYKINECCLRVLKLLAQGKLSGNSAAEPFARVTVHRDLWLALDERALRRAAQAPVLLVDIHFQNVDWYNWAKTHGAKSAKSPNARAAFPVTRARELMEMTMMLAWHTARAELPTATQILGIGRAVAERIARLDPLDVQRIAKGHFRELKPRWEENLNFWQTLLLAALKDDETSLFDAYQEGTQLLFTDVLPGVR